MNVGETGSNKSPLVSCPTTLGPTDEGLIIAPPREGVNVTMTTDVMERKGKSTSMKENKKVKILQREAPDYLFGDDDDDDDDDHSEGVDGSESSSPDTAARGPSRQDPSRRDEGMHKDDLIRSISERLASSQPHHNHNSHRQVPSNPHSYNHQNVHKIASITQSRFCLSRALEDIQRWLFTVGDESEDMETFLTSYTECVNDLGIALDRVKVGVIMFQPNISSFLWKWERGVPFEARHMHHQEFMKRKEMHGESAPFNVLMDTNAPHVHLRASDIVLPNELDWMKKLGYEEYFALQIKHKGEFKGAVAWSTKQKGGFHADHIKFLQQSMRSLSTILRTHTSEVVMSHLVGRLQEEVDNRIQELAQANEDLARANRHVVNQSQAQLRHFAMMVSL